MADMVGFSCFRCTRIFEWPAKPSTDRIPSHVDLLVGAPCAGTGDAVLYYT